MPTFFRRDKKKLTCTRVVAHSFHATVSSAWVAFPPLTPHPSKPRYRALSLILLFRRKSLATVTVMAATLQSTEMALVAVLKATPVVEDVSVIGGLVTVVVASVVVAGSVVVVSVVDVAVVL